MLWRERRWSLLLNLIDHLPGDSHYTEARANDDELVEVLLATGDDGPEEVRPRISEWSGQRDEIARVGDLMVQLIDTVRGVNGNPPSGLKLRSRPETSFDRLERREGLAQHQALVRHLTAVPDPPA